MCSKHCSSDEIRSANAMFLMKIYTSLSRLASAEPKATSTVHVHAQLQGLRQASDDAQDGRLCPTQGQSLKEA